MTDENEKNQSQKEDGSAATTPEEWILLCHSTKDNSEEALKQITDFLEKKNQILLLKNFPLPSNLPTSRNNILIIKSPLVLEAKNIDN